MSSRIYNPDCPPDELGRQFAAYLPLCASISARIGGAEGIFDLQLLNEAAIQGLEIAAQRWNPNRASCDHGCILAPRETRCQHDGTRVTLGAYARKFISGEVIMAMRNMRIGFRDTHSPRTDYYNLPEIICEEMLPDSSSPDGSESDDRWGSCDNANLLKTIEAGILSGEVAVVGMTMDTIREVVSSLSLGRSFAETAKFAGCSDKSVARVVASLRRLLAKTDFGEKTVRPVKEYSLGQLVSAICAKYYPEASEKTRQTISKRIGKWASVGKLGATRGADRRWIFSPMGMTRCLDMWRELAAAERGRR